MYFPEELKDHECMRELMQELILVSPKGMKSKFDDMIDTVSQLASLQSFRPSQEVISSNDGNNIWEFEEDDLDDNRLNSYVV